MKLHTFYSDYVSTHYQHVAPASQASYRKRYYVWKSYLTQFLPSEKNCKILEIGCGVGHNLYSLQALGYVNMLGTDYSPECVKLCRQHGYTSQIVNEKTEKIFYATNKKKFDLVILYDVLEHYTPENAVDLLVLIRGLLKDKGNVLISLPNASHPLSNVLLFADITHKFIYNEISLAQLLRNSGFIDFRFKQINSFTATDDDIKKKLVKQYILPIFSSTGELFWKLLALSQGIFLNECKPTLIAYAQK